MRFLDELHKRLILMNFVTAPTPPPVACQRLPADAAMWNYATTGVSDRPVPGSGTPEFREAVRG